MTPRDNTVTGGATKTLSDPPSADAHDVREVRGMLHALEELGYDLDALLASAGLQRRDVEDPEGFRTELISELRMEEQRLDLWLVNGAEAYRSDPELCDALLKVARHEDSRRCFILLAEILETPGLADRLLQVLKEQPV